MQKSLFLELAKNWVYHHLLSGTKTLIVVIIKYDLLFGGPLVVSSWSGMSG